MSHDMELTAKALVADGRGILAADESFPTIEKRFKSINIPSTEDNRRDYRQMLFATPGSGRFISGAILFDETLRQKTSDGRSMVELLNASGIIPGIKVDCGAKPMAGHPNEKVTEGLDGLRDRLAEYFQLGARFAKWRAVITIGDGIPSQGCLEANAHALARYASLCQEASIVPIVEPEVLMDGDHDLARCEAVTTAALDLVFGQLKAQNVRLEAMLLKPNMVISGKAASQRADVETVAKATVRTLLRCVPAAVPGIVFLSGGQTPTEATAHLDAMNKLGSFPWKLSYSYGRALQEPALNAWAGQADHVEKAQRVFHHRAECNSKASLGTYSPAMETA